MNRLWSNVRKGKGEGKREKGEGKKGRGRKRVCLIFGIICKDVVVMLLLPGRASGNPGTSEEPFWMPGEDNFRQRAMSHGGGGLYVNVPFLMTEQCQSRKTKFQEGKGEAVKPADCFSCTKDKGRIDFMC